MEKRTFDSHRLGFDGQQYGCRASPKMCTRILMLLQPVNKYTVNHLRYLTQSLAYFRRAFMSNRKTFILESTKTTNMLRTS